MVRIHPDPPTDSRGPPRRTQAEPGGAIAQLGERLLCKQEVTGSIPVGSTSDIDVGCPASPGSPARKQQSTPRAMLIGVSSKHFGCSLTIWNEGSCPRERDLVMRSWVAWTLGYVLHRALAEEAGVHKRESFL